MKRKSFILIATIVAASGLTVILNAFVPNHVLSVPALTRTISYTAKVNDIPAKTDALKSSSTGFAFEETFSKRFTVEENWPMSKSGNPDWWVSSGAYFVSENGIGRSLQGDLSPSDRWYKAFGRSNARDTEGGLRPQNIFRLVLRKLSTDSSQKVYARINYYDSSKSEFRNESNGILLFNRYQDADNLYYAGIRVDGLAVVKKKLRGEYSTLGISKVFDDSSPSREQMNDNVLPLKEWIGVRSIIRDLEDGSVRIDVFVDRAQTGKWERVLSVVDDGVAHGSPIHTPGLAGIRTDFMDVEFDNYSLTSLR